MQPWLNAQLPAEERVQLLLQEMTLEECIWQLDQVRIDQVTDEDIRKGVGSVILASSATAGNDQQAESKAAVIDALQQRLRTESRLGIPTITGRDVIHGHNTVFPIPLGQAAAWDPEIVRQGCRAAAVEASADGVHWTFSPMLDIARDGRWGRIAEGYGESPYLTGVLGVAAVRGYQTENLADPTAIAACAKHYVGYGAAEGGRDYNATEITTTSLQDVYLPPFEMAIRAECQTVMSSFNEIGGIPAAINHHLLTTVLREQWSFDGFVVTDWNAVAETMAHGVAADGADASIQAVSAGADMDMVDRLYIQHLLQAVEQGDIDEAIIRTAAARILLVKFRLGLFDQQTMEREAVDRTLHRLLSRDVAARCSILLHNDGALPLAQEGGTIAVVGPLAHATADLFGTWTLDGIPGEVTSLSDALTQAFPQRKIVHPPWHDASMVSHQVHQAAVSVLILGETPSRSGEANSVVDPGLPPGQQELLEQLLLLGKPIILVLVAGRPLVLPDSVHRCAAILYNFHPGTDGALGIADVISGVSEPTGRLPITLPRHAGQIPLYHDHKPTGRPLNEYHRPPEEDGFYRYLDCPGSPRWPFGYGLGYGCLKVSEQQAEADDAAQCVYVDATVSNTSGVTTSTIIQVYCHDPVAENSQPVRRLVAFESITLEPNALGSVQFTIPYDRFAYTHRDGSRRSDSGLLHMYLGQHSSDGQALPVTITIQETA